MRTFQARRFADVQQSDIRRMTLECDRVGGINLAQGLCQVAPPEPVLRAAATALAEAPQSYSRPAGIPELRRALAAKLRRDNGIDADPDSEIVVTAGVTGAYFCTLYALLDPGDGILLFAPFYGYHRNIARVAGLVPRPVPLDPLHGRVDEAALRAAADERTRAVVVCTPSNPGGKVFSREDLEAIARVAHERDWLVITDEIYEYFVYDGRRHVSPATVGGLWPRSVSLMGASKTFAITGWRIGWAVAPEPLARRVMLANDLTLICAPRPLQHAVADGVDALPPEWYASLARSFEAKRDRLCDALAAGGFAPVVPEGAYYAMADVRPLGFDRARDAAMALLERSGVATVPGTAFRDDAAGEHHLRVCFALEDAVLDDACARIRAFRR